MSEGTLALRRERGAVGPLAAVLSDERLAKLAAKGSAPAFTAIYKRHHQEIYRYCRSIVANEDDARDALQETMLKAMRALDGETREIALRPWLYRIAHNEAIAIVRKRRPTTSIQDLTEPAASADDLEARDRLRELVEDLGQLAPRQRSALVMRELSGLSFEQIGAALGTSPGGAKQAVYEARQGLQELERGRETTCLEIRAQLSAEDRRVLRGRRVRAHLKACPDCREFQASIDARRTQLTAIAPLPAPVALGILHGILGGGGGGGGVAAVAAGGSMAGLAKLGIAGVIALGVGTVALEQNGPGAGNSRAGQAGKAEELREVTGESAVAGRSAVSESAGERSSADAGREDPPAAGGGDDPAGGSAQANAGVTNANAESPGSAAGAAGADPPSAAVPGTPASPETGKDPSGQGPAGLPPGHGGTPPGQGGTPPGLGTPPPGQGGTPPGQPGTPPGQSGTAPGQSETPPGQSGTAPGQSGLAPGQSGSTPGQSGSAPGQS